MLLEKPCKNTTISLELVFFFFNRSTEINVQQSTSTLFVLGTYKTHSLTSGTIYKSYKHKPMKQSELEISPR